MVWLVFAGVMPHCGTVGACLSDIVGVCWSDAAEWHHWCLLE